MDVGNQALRLLREMERHDQETSALGESGLVGPTELLAALIDTGFDLPAAIIGVVRGA